MAPRRHRRCLTPTLHRDRSAGVRRVATALSRRPSVPRDDNPLYARVRAPADEDRTERSRRLPVARLPLVQHRQGVHDPRARLGKAGLERITAITPAEARVIAAAGLSGAAIDVPVGVPQSRLLHLAHRIAWQRIDKNDLFGRLEFRQAMTERG